MNRWPIEALAARLAEPLPGPIVASRYAPRGPSPCHYRAAPAGARQAAVLVLLYPHQGRWHLPLTLRPAHLAEHAGQVSLPGGALEPGETAAEAALREFHEELGAREQPIELLGRLSPIYVEVSNFHVEPWVGLSDRRPDMTPCPFEVESLLEVPLDGLVDPANFVCGEPGPQGSGQCPHFLWHGYRIWGATCMILGELVTLLEELGTKGCRL